MTLVPITVARQKTEVQSSPFDGLAITSDLTKVRIVSITGTTLAEHDPPFYLVGELRQLDGIILVLARY